jgi:Rhodanase C-terminal
VRQSEKEICSASVLYFRGTQNSTHILYVTSSFSNLDNNAHTRCERASAFLNTKYGDKVKGVFQLQGGIEAYLKQYPSGGYWRGKNFVFDKRESVSAYNPNGDGGVLKPKQEQEQPVKSTETATTTAAGASSSSDSIETHCCICGKAWDRYIGKKKCNMCGVPVLVCDVCLASPQQNQQVKRCPLCVEQNVTVPAADVEWTDNGKAAVVVAADTESSLVSPAIHEGTASSTQKKAAPSVLKWGGGHAAKKKEKRRFRSQPCRFGANCTRPGCFFAHPNNIDKPP